jgi:hypothetical protein
MKDPKLPLSVFMAKAPSYSCQHQTSVKIENEEIISLLSTDTLVNSLHSCYLHLRRYRLMLLVTTSITSATTNSGQSGYWRRRQDWFQVFDIQHIQAIEITKSFAVHHSKSNYSPSGSRERNYKNIFIASHPWNGERHVLYRASGIVVAKPFQGRSHLKATFLNVNYSPDIFYLLKSTYSAGEFVIVRLLQLEITSGHTSTFPEHHIIHSRV